MVYLNRIKWNPCAGVSVSSVSSVVAEALTLSETYKSFNILTELVQDEPDFEIKHTGLYNCRFRKNSNVV